MSLKLQKQGALKSFRRIIQYRLIGIGNYPRSGAGFDTALLFLALFKKNSIIRKNKQIRYLELFG
jgi:hypothetical protein